jgi:hypothetical protein
MSPSEEDFDARIQETIQKIDAAVAEAEASSAKLDQLQGSVGLSRGVGKRYLEKVPPAERQKAEQELAALKEEVERDLAHAAGSTPGTSVKPKAGRIRV